MKNFLQFFSAHLHPLNLAPHHCLHQTLTLPVVIFFPVFLSVHASDTTHPPIFFHFPCPVWPPVFLLRPTCAPYSAASTLDNFDKSVPSTAHASLILFRTGHAGDSNGWDRCGELNLILVLVFSYCWKFSTYCVLWRSFLSSAYWRGVLNSLESYMMSVDSFRPYSLYWRGLINT